MNVLVVGNMGYVGSVLVGELRRSDKEIRIDGLDIGYYAHCTVGYDQAPEVVLSTQQFEDVRSIGKLRNYDAVVYLAAISNDSMGNRFARHTAEINRVSCEAMARRCAAAGTKSFVLSSSCSIYGKADDGTLLSESAEARPLTAYAKSKVEAEDALRLVASDYPSMAITCLRFATACGASPRLRLDLVLNDFVASALGNKCIVLLSDGSPWRPLIDVRDMSSAIRWAIQRRASGTDGYLTVNVGERGCNRRVIDIAKEVASLLPGTTLDVSATVSDSRSYRVDFSLYEQLAQGYLPNRDLNYSIRSVIKQLTEGHVNTAGFRNSPRYSRLKTLEYLVNHNHLNEDLQWMPPQ